MPNCRDIEFYITNSPPSEETKNKVMKRWKKKYLTSRAHASYKLQVCTRIFLVTLFPWCVDCSWFPPLRAASPSSLAGPLNVVFQFTPWLATTTVTPCCCLIGWRLWSWRQRWKMGVRKDAYMRGYVSTGCWLKTNKHCHTQAGLYAQNRLTNMLCLTCNVWCI